MNSEWQNLPGSADAQIDDGIVQPFTTLQEQAKTTTEQTIITPLSHLGLIKICGEDVTSFLQNQFTNDIREVTKTSSQLNAWCSPKGRALACFRLFRVDECYYMQLPVALILATLERLRKYIMMSRVTLEDCSEELVSLGIAGAGAEAILNKQSGAPPVQINEVIRHDYCTLIKIPGPSDRFIVTGKPARLVQLWSSISSDAQSVGSSCWRLLDIRAGVPNIYPETVEAFVPQMLNLQAIGGLSFTKGCYPGQEVVARMQYLGKLKRCMYRALVNAEMPPVPGDMLCIASSNRNTGKIVDAHAAPQGRYELLAVVEIAPVEASEKICLENNSEAVLEFVDLPYSVEQGEKQ